MKIVKKYEKDETTLIVSKLFDMMIKRNLYPMPFDRLELHIRDYNVTVVEDNKAIICINYNNPLVQEKDMRGIKTVIRHELVRLMLGINLPKPIEDVIVGREMIKRGMEDELFYMYYIYMMRTVYSNRIEDYIKINLPWIIFHGYDDYNSSVLKNLAGALFKNKMPETHRLFDILIHLSDRNLKEAKKEYKKLTKR